MSALRLPATSGQRRLWTLDRQRPGLAAYNVAAAYRLPADVDARALAGALDDLVARHEPLRTTFAPDAQGEPEQLVHEPGPADFALLDLPDAAAQEARVREEAHRPFDLAEGPLFRAALLRAPDAEPLLVLTFHHAVVDGWSLGVLRRDLARLHRARATGAPSGLPELPIQLADYAAWERERDLSGPVARRRDRLAGVPDLALPLDRPRPAQPSGRGGRVPLALGPETARALRRLCEAERATPFMACLAAFQALLHRWGGQEDFAIGTPASGRTRPETHDLVGFLVNTLALRADLSGEPSFRRLLARARAETLDALADQDAPFDRVVDALRLPREGARNPLVQAMLTFEEAEREGGADEGLRMRPEHPRLDTAKLDLALSLEAGPEGLAGALDYDADLFEPDTARRMAAHFVALLEAALRDPDAPLARIPLLTDGERRALAALHDATPPDETAPSLPDLVARHAAAHPGRPAVEAQDARLTYAELDARADRLARRLRAAGVGRETPVVVCLERSADLVVSFLAVLRAGGAYVPLDPAYPAARVRLVLEETRAPVALARPRHAHLLEGAPRVLALDAEEESAAAPGEASGEAPRPADLAYVIYTSGSTGRPKGVCVERRSLDHFLAHQVRLLGLGPDDRVLQAASPGFDPSVFEMGVALAAGATLVVAGADDPRTGPALGRLLRERRVSVAGMTPSAWKTVPPGGYPDLRLVLSGGEACPRELVDAWAPGRRFVNAYGPTEATVCATMAFCEAGAPLAPPIGRPVPGATVDLLDARGQPVPPGVVGEVHLGGPGLARGYLGRPDLTAERFVRLADGRRVYRTGDRARLRGDGHLEFVGRVDEQVKVRGHRIEPGEVEAALLAHPSVAQCAVLALPDAEGERRLVAYLAHRTGAPRPSVGALRDFLKARLPPQMLPSLFVRLDALPLTPHGKVDRRALPAPEAARPDVGTPYAPPRTPTERLLADAWARTLGVPQVGAQDNFFELGGDSLLALKATARANALGLALEPRDLFERQTVAALAALVDGGPAPRAFASLVTLQTGEGRAPVFFVHPGGGMVGSYAALARALGKDRPFHAFQALGADRDDEAPHLRIEDMAAFYLSELRRAQPRGPYRLGGWSLGGMVAYEMARRLRAEGEDVALLALVDAGLAPDGHEMKEVADLVDACERALAHGEEPDAAGRAAVASTLRRLGMPVDLDEEGLSGARRRLRLFQAQLRAGMAYAPGPYAGPVALFLSEDSARRDPEVPARWRRHVAGEVALLQVPGDHWSMVLQADAPGGLAERLRDALDRAEGGA